MLLKRSQWRTGRGYPPARDFGRAQKFLVGAETTARNETKNVQFYLIIGQMLT